MGASGVGRLGAGGNQRGSGKGSEGSKPEHETLHGGPPEGTIAPLSRAIRRPAVRRQTTCASASVLRRQPDVVLGQRPAGSFGADQIVEFGLLDAPARTHRHRGKRCSSAGHPPREPLRLPHRASKRRGIGVEFGDRACLVLLDQRVGEVAARRWRPRFSPLAPVGGTICAASPARNRRRSASARQTKLRSGAMLFSMRGRR